MDETEEILKESIPIEDNELEGNSWLKSENSVLENETNFNLDEVLDEGNPTPILDADASLNIVDEEESQADLDMNKWLADDSESVDVSLDTSDNSESIISLDVEPERADSISNIVSEEEMPNQSSVDLDEQTASFANDMPAAELAGTEWLADTTAENSTDDIAENNIEDIEPEIDSDKNVLDSGGGWLAQEQEVVSENDDKVFDEMDISSDEDSRQSENEGESFSSNSWLAEDKAEENPELEPKDISLSGVDALSEDFEAAPMEDGDENSKSSWLNPSEDHVAFLEDENVSEETLLASEEAEPDEMHLGEENTAENADLSLSATSGTTSEASVVAPLFDDNISSSENSNANFLRWYSGTLHDEMFEISKNDMPEAIVGTDEKQIIHINVGYETYGWLVEFSNDIMMSLEDVRRYQIKNGSLPGSDGVIRYGQKRCTFSGISRILIYESVRYFSYGS